LYSYLRLLSVLLGCSTVSATMKDGAWRADRDLDDKRVYRKLAHVCEGTQLTRLTALILAYGASTATTVVPTIAAILKYPVSPSLSTGEIANLLSSYVPFFLIPFGMALDMGIRVTKIISQNQLKKSL
jgi:hypothetical protein